MSSILGAQDDPRQPWDTTRPVVPNQNTDTAALLVSKSVNIQAQEMAQASGRG